MKLTSDYLGLTLENPLIASCSPLTGRLDTLRALADGGVAAVVLPSLFEEQLRHEAEAVDHFLSLGTDSFGEASDGFFPAFGEVDVGLQRTLDLVETARAAIDVPVIASLNGVTSTGWTRHAKDLESAGASAIELNVFYIPSELDVTGGAVEDRYLDALGAVKSAVSIPVAMKLSPYFSAFGHMAKRLAEGGADGLVLFNRFYQPDYDLESLAAVPTLDLSTSREMRLPLLWLAILRDRVPASLAATTGVQTGQDVAKYLLAGADAVMTTTALLRHGPGHARVLLDELEAWMREKAVEDVSKLRGSMSQVAIADQSAYQRANYLKVLQSYDNPYG